MANDTKFRIIVIAMQAAISAVALGGTFAMLAEGKIAAEAAIAVIAGVVGVWLPGPGSLARPDAVHPTATASMNAAGSSIQLDSNQRQNG